MEYEITIKKNGSSRTAEASFDLGTIEVTWRVGNVSEWCADAKVWLEDSGVGITSTVPFSVHDGAIKKQERVENWIRTVPTIDWVKRELKERVERHIEKREQAIMQAQRQEIAMNAVNEVIKALEAK